MCPFKWTMRGTGEMRSRAMSDQDDRLVGFHQDLETVFVSVRSHLAGVKLTDQVAEDLAHDYLTEIGWFGEESLGAKFIF